MAKRNGRNSISRDMAIHDAMYYMTLFEDSGTFRKYYPSEFMIIVRNGLSTDMKEFFERKQTERLLNEQKTVSQEG